ncbi:hypothetical protein [Ruegeria sp. ANG-R]|nr:hypothetical protein [Ruegeria sp. ANG-R]
MTEADTRATHGMIEIRVCKSFVILGPMADLCQNGSSPPQFRISII